MNEKTEGSENRFQMLEGANPINSKLKEMISEAKDEIAVLGSEKDYLRLYHSDFLDNFSNNKCKSKIITSCSEKTMYIFENIDKSQIKCMKSNIKDEVCFVMKDNQEMIFFTKKDGQSMQDVSAMWTDSSALIYSMKLLFDFIWASSKSV